MFIFSCFFDCMEFLAISKTKKFEHRVRLTYVGFFQITVRGKNYRRQLTTATLAARSAAQMPLQVKTVLNHIQFSLGTGKGLFSVI